MDLIAVKDNWRGDDVRYLKGCEWEGEREGREREGVVSERVKDKEKEERGK